MAGGNMGDLWFELGIRDKSSKPLNKVLKKVQNLDGLILELNKQIADGEKGKKKQLSNALNYLRMLQQIAQEERKIKDLQKMSAGADTTSLKNALKLLTDFREQLFKLQSGGQKGGGGVDAAYITGFQQALRNTLADVKNIENAFKNENALSVFKSNAARLTNELEKVKNKLAEIYSMQSIGMKGGFDTSSLLGAGNSLRGVKKRIESMLNNPTQLGDEAKIKQLLSDISLAYTKVAGKVADYNREKQKSISATREEAEKQKEIEKATKNAAQAEKQRQREIEVTKQRIQSMEKALYNLQEKRFTTKMLGFDTSEADAKINHMKNQLADLRDILQDLKTRGTAALGQIGSRGNGREVQSANNLAAMYDRVNKEAQKGVEIEKKRQQEIEKSAAKARSELVNAFKQAQSSAGSVNSTVQDLKNLIMQGGIVYGAHQFLMSVIQTGGELERQHIALQSILGDMQNADTMYGQIKRLALESPFTFSELNKDVKQLAAYGVEYDQLYDTTKRLADMASGLGVSFERIALAFGQVQARGWLDGKELRQIAYAGIPLLDKLSKMYSQREGKKVSTSEVKTRISNREVSFEDVKSIFWEMTDAGGQFYNMQQTLSETLLGRYNKLKDAWEIMLSDFASGTSMTGKLLMGVLNILTSIVQGMHTFGPVMAAMFSGYALKKFVTTQSDGITSFLSNKSKLADSYARKIAEGGTLSAIERQILATKNRITNADLQQLATARALTQNDLNRLRVCGAITAEQYNTYRGIVAQQNGTWTLKMQIARIKVAMRSMQIGNVWTNFSSSAMASFRIIATGAKALGATLWSAIGGLPGLLITGVTMAFAYFVNKSAQLKSEMDTVSSELKDRFKSISEILRDMPAFSIIMRGDSKEIDNAIDSYKEKIKQIAPYDYSNLVMQAEERKSHEDRLAYLAGELRLIQKANGIAQNKLESSNIYERLKSGLENLSEDYDRVTTNANEDNPILRNIDKVQLRKEYLKGDLDYKEYADKMAAKIQEVFGDISKDKKALSTAQQAMTSIMAQMELPEDKANVIRASVLQSFGLVDGWLKDQVGSKMSGLISTTAPLIADKIRSGKQLTDAEKEKVKELIQDAKQGLANQYPEVERTIQSLLNGSHFKAVIDLVVNNMGEYGDLQKTMSDRLGNASYLSNENRNKYLQYINSWGASGSWYDARNNAKNAIDKAYNELKSARESNASKEQIAKLQTEYDNAVGAAKTMLNYDYSGDDKKSNKEKHNGNKSDEALKAWQERLSAYKSARQAYQKYKDVMGEAEAKNTIESLFDNIDGLDLTNYAASIKKLESELDFSKSTERKKALTSLRQELADWHFSEELKPEFDRIAAEFSEALEKGASQFDLYKSLLEKTGSKSFAMQAFSNGTLWNDEATGLAKQFKELMGFDVDVNASDATAKHYLVDVKGSQQAYDLWKKIVDLVQGEFTDALKTQADLIEKSLNYAEQIENINNKYDKIVAEANNTGNHRGAVAANIQRNKEVGEVKLKQFKNSSDYLDFYGAIMSLGLEKAQNIGNKIRDNINEALRSGAIDAREYAKEIKQLNEQLDKVTKSRKSFLNGGLRGIADRNIEDANEKYTLASDKIDEGREKIKNGYLTGDNDLINEGASEVLEGEDIQEEADKLHKKGLKLQEALDEVVNIANIFSTNVQGICDTFNDIKETATALGVDTESDGWQDASAFFESLSGINNSISNIVKGAESGNIGGILSGVVGIFTSPIKAFAKAHDNKLERQITLAKEQIDELKNISSNIQSAVDSALGGVYSYNRSSATTNKFNDYLKQVNSINKLFGGGLGKLLGYGIYTDDTVSAINKANSADSAYYDQMASLKLQRDLIQKQRNAEADKKDSDSTKISDYDQQLIEMDQTIKNFAQDFLKEIYSVDMKSWASELTDAVVSAWQNGEDAVQAYYDKAKELVTSLTKNILSQKIMEKALQPALDYLTKELDDNNGLLTENSINGLWKILNEGSENAVSNITNVLEMLKKQGLDLSDNGSSSTSNSIKSITEETADLLASYINSIRLDVSVNRDNIQKIADTMQVFPEMNVIAKSQLSSLNQLVDLATYRNDKLDDMYSLMRKVTNGTEKIYVV